MTTFFKIAAGIMSLCMAIFFVGIFLLLICIFCGGVFLCVPFFVLVLIYLFTRVMYEEMLIHIEKHTFTNYIEVSEQDNL